MGQEASRKPWGLSVSTGVEELRSDAWGPAQHSPLAAQKQSGSGCFTGKGGQVVPVSPADSSEMHFSLWLFSHSVISNSLRPHGLQHTRLPCPSESPGACSLMSIESVMKCNHLILCPPLLLPPSIFRSIRGSFNESALHIR